ncbi:MAG: hypothetical protein JW395_3339 [Nitrospira sp.]|nr:hypothetical protein [Nitrospira sp.]
MTLSHKAMLTSLSITTWSGRRLDRNASRDVVEKNNAQAANAARVTKQLIDTEVLEGPVRVGTEARNFHYSLTLPWANDGSRILPSALFFAYTGGLSQLQSKFESAVDHTMSMLPNELTRAQYRLGDLYNASDYPDTDAIRGKYQFDTNMLPFPSTDDFRINLSKEEAEELRVKMQHDITATTNDAIKSAWMRIYDAVTHMSERLNAYSRDENGKASTRLYSTVISNAEELAAILPSLNIVDDPMLKQCAANLKKLCRHDTEALKKSSGLRKEISMEADAIAKTIDAMMAS